VSGTEVDGLPPAPGGGRRRLAGATMGMAVGTTLSRITGVGRVVALAAIVGGGGFADAYNLANTTPNIIYDIVLGGILSATFVPVFVDHLSTRKPSEAWEAISAVVTVTVAVLVAATVVFFLLTPEIIHLYTVTNHQADVGQQQAVAIFLLRWFVAQVAFYGLIALFTALLNARGKFAAPMFVPIANNVVVIVVLLTFHAMVPHPSLASIDAHHTALVLLGLGTTLGVVAQAVCLIPSLVRTDLHVRFLWRPAHRAVRTITGLAGWTLGLVVANQVALLVVLALADGSTPGAVSAYTYAYTFFLLPYGVVAVSVMTAVTPSLSARWAQRDVAGFRHRMAFGLRGILAIIIPSAVGMIILSRPLIDLVLAHASETTADAHTTAATLAMFALGLPGFCTFLYMIRVLQSMQDARTAFKLYLVENTINIVVGVALVGSLGVRGLALSVSIAYSFTALLAMAVVRQRIGGLGGKELTEPVRRVVGATAVMGVTTVLALSVSGASSGLGLLVRVMFAVVVGAVTYLATAGFLGAREAHRRADQRAPRGALDAPAPHGDPALVRHREEAPPSSADPFRGRIDVRPGPGDSSVRHLRPVGDAVGEPIEPGGDPAAGSDPRREEPKEDDHGPDQGGNR
jgi:putative peptidoglycan lipid II flippase